MAMKGLDGFAVAEMIHQGHFAHDDERQVLLDALDAVPRETFNHQVGEVFRLTRAAGRDRAERAERERDELRADNERLREALRPFAEFLDALDAWGGSDPPGGWVVRIARIASDPPVTLHIQALHRARAALEGRESP